MRPFRITGFVLAVALAGACQTRPAPPALLEDSQSQQDARTNGSIEQGNADAMMTPTPELIASLEAAVKANPEDLATRRRLLMLYGRNGRTEKVIGRDAVIAARRGHILWMIANHPELPLNSDVRLPPRNGWALADPEGYLQGKALWLAEVAKPGASAQVVANAAAFLEDGDQPLALTLWKRAHAKEPANPFWMDRLGNLYARVLATTSPQEAAGANRTFVQNIAKDLETTTDTTLLVAAGSTLAMSAAARFAGPGGADPGTVALGKAYVDRALALDPHSVAAHRAKVAIQASERRARLQPLLRGVTKGTGAEYQAIRSTPASDRLAFSMILAEQAYSQGNSASYRRDKTATDQAWTLSKTYANDALSLAATLPNDPVSSAATYRSHIVLAMLALRAGDGRGAVRHMLDASGAQPSEELAYGSDPYSTTLVAYLLEYGERDSVIEFLRRTATLRLDRKDTMLADIETIRAGRLPATYRGVVTR